MPAVAESLPVAPPVRSPGQKLASRVAARIVEDVVALGWPVGEVIGSEAELLDRYNVSRAVLREAVRLVEHQQVARMRRGPGGGLMVTEPSVDAIIDAAVLYLHRLDARLDEVFEARLVLEEIAADLAPGRLDEDDLAGLRRLLEHEATGAVTDHRAFHSLLASMTRNPALELFVDILNRVTLLYRVERRELGPATLEASAHAHAKIAEAVMAGDDGLARHRMRKHLEAEARFLRSRRTTRQVLDPEVAINGAPGSKRAEGVARQMFHDIVLGRLPPGQLLGSEAELMDHHGVSRAILREAVRLLEHHHIATMRRGPGGGLFVAPPSVVAVSDVVALYLERHGIGVAHLAELRVGIELALVGLVIDRMDPEAEARLASSLEHERHAPDDDFVDAAHDLHATVGSLSGNRVLDLVVRVLVRLSRIHQVDALPDRARRRIGAEVVRAHDGIVEALVAADRELARHRMRRHLDALTGFLR